MTANLNDPRYPLGETATDVLQAASGRAFADVSMDAVLNGEITAQDVVIRAETLEAQAEIARQAGYERLASNLQRAAELTRVPNTELLKMYEALRPNRSTYEQLLALAIRLEEKYHAPFTAEFVREAAEVYKDRGLLK
jgi:propanediol dehydratase small subunit